MGNIVTSGAVISSASGQGFSFNFDTSFEVMRYSSNGSIDTSFGHAGGVITEFSSFAGYSERLSR